MGQKLGHMFWLFLAYSNYQSLRKLVTVSCKCNFDKNQSFCFVPKGWLWIFTRFNFFSQLSVEKLLRRWPVVQKRGASGRTAGNGKPPGTTLAQSLGLLWIYHGCTIGRTDFVAQIIPNHRIFFDTLTNHWDDGMTCSNPDIIHILSINQPYINHI